MLIGKIREIRENLSVRGDPKAKAQLDFTRKAEKLFMQALSEAGGVIDATGKIHIANREDEELTRENGVNMQVSAEKSGVKRLSNPKSVDNLTEEQYNNFGWVRANDVLNSGEWKDFTSKFADAVTNQTNPPRTKSGEYMIAVSDIDDALHYGVDNFIVYAKGSIESPQVSQVLEIDLDNGTQIDEHRRNVYALERRGIQPKIGGIFHLYSATDSRYLRNGQDYNIQSSGYNDQLGTDRGAGGSGVAEAERGQVSGTVRADSRLIPPATVPLRHEYVDITGNKRYVMAREGGQYSVYGTWSPSPHDLHPSIEAAIEAENNNLLRAYARDTDHTVTWVKRQLQSNPDFLKAWGKNRLLEKMPKGYVSRSRNVSETVTLSKGQIAALRANYEGDKVFTKKDVATAVKSIDALQKLPAAVRNELVTHLWRGYNERLNEQGFDMFTEIMWHKIHAEILQETGFEMTEDEIRAMDEQIVNALHTIVKSGKPSVRAKLESAT